MKAFGVIVVLGCLALSGCATTPHRVPAAVVPAVTQQTRQLEAVTHEVRTVREYVVHTVTNEAASAFITNRLDAIEEHIRDVTDQLTVKDQQLTATREALAGITDRYNALVDRTERQDGEIKAYQTELRAADQTRHKAVIKWGSVALGSGVAGAFLLKLLFKFL